MSNALSVKSTTCVTRSLNLNYTQTIIMIASVAVIESCELHWHLRSSYHGGAIARSEDCDVVRVPFVCLFWVLSCFFQIKVAIWPSNIRNTTTSAHFYGIGWTLNLREEKFCWRVTSFRFRQLLRRNWWPKCEVYGVKFFSPVPYFSVLLALQQL